MQTYRATITESCTAPAARIGLNSLIQTVHALRDRDIDNTRITAFLTRLNETSLLTTPPQTMVDEQRFARMITESAHPDTTVDAALSEDANFIFCRYVVLF